MESELQGSAEAAAKRDAELYITGDLPPCRACWFLFMIYVLCVSGLKTGLSAAANAKEIGLG